MIYNHSFRITPAEKKRRRAQLRIDSQDPINRLAVYKQILIGIKECKEQGWAAGFCTNFPDEYSVFDHTKRMIMFPELRSHKPKTPYGRGWWFQSNDYTTRIKILKTIINQMAETN